MEFAKHFYDLGMKAGIEDGQEIGFDLGYHKRMSEEW